MDKFFCSSTFPLRNLFISYFESTERLALKYLALLHQQDFEFYFYQ